MGTLTRKTEPHQKCSSRKRPAGDELVGAVGHRGQEGGGPEHDQPELQRTLAPEAVAEGAGRKEQAGEDDGVGVDDPLELGLGGVQVLEELGQGDVERAVAHHHQHQAQAEDTEDLPAARVHGGVDARGRGGVTILTAGDGVITRGDHRGPNRRFRAGIPDPVVRSPP
jgi:hypothetical protein